MNRFFSLVALLAICSVANAQTTGVAGSNDFTVNGLGSGGTSMVATALLSGPQTVTLAITGTSGDFVVLAAGNPFLGLVVLPDGTSVDVDLSGGIFYDGTGTFTAAPSLPFSTGSTNTNGNWVLAAATDLSLANNTSVQAALIGPSHAGGVTLTQAHSLTVTVVPTATPVYSNTIGGDLSPLSDDGSINVTFSNPAGFTFYGVTYTSVWVNMNGNLTFNSGSTDFNPTSPEMLSMQPRIAPLWDDWTPNDVAQGTVRVFDDGATFQCEWFDVRAFGAACTGVGDTNTFGASLDFATFDIETRYDVALLCNPPYGTAPSIDQIIGLSPGGGLSAAVSVDLSSAPVTALTTDALFEDFAISGPLDFGFDAIGPRAHMGVLFSTAGGAGAVVATPF